MNLSNITKNHLPDSIGELFALQKTIIGELKQKNKIYTVADGELGFLTKQNHVLKSQIERIYDLMDRFCGDRHSDADLGMLDFA